MQRQLPYFLIYVLHGHTTSVWGSAGPEAGVTLTYKLRTCHQLVHEIKTKPC